MLLNERKIKELEALDKEYKVSDGNGLILRIFPSGKKSWIFQYSIKQKRYAISFGLYPAINLKMARAKVHELKHEIFLGNNPKDEEKRNFNTFKKVTDEWLIRKSNICSDAYLDVLKIRLNNYILPALGNKIIDEIKAFDVLQIVRKAEKEKKFETASRILGISSQIFRFAVACTYCSSDPCRDLKGALTPFKQKPMAAITKPKEVAKLMKNIKSYPVANMRNALLFSAYTFCRPGEIRHAEWNEIDFDEQLWRIPAEKMKMRGEHVVPLSKQCIEILLKQKGLNDTWVFPANRANKGMSENGTLSAIRTMGYSKEEMCAHGFRAMASTLLNEKGYNPDVIEKCLAHESKNKIRAIYNRAQYLPERVKLMQEYADYLDELANKE